MKLVKRRCLFQEETMKQRTSKQKPHYSSMTKPILNQIETVFFWCIFRFSQMSNHPDDFKPRLTFHGGLVLQLLQEISFISLYCHPPSQNSSPKLLCSKSYLHLLIYRKAYKSLHFSWSQFIGKSYLPEYSHGGEGCQPTVTCSCSC